MLIAGAGRHAKDIVAALEEVEEPVFFDDVTKPSPELFLNKFKIYSLLEEAKAYFEHQDKRFILGIGGTTSRKKIYDKLKDVGGEAVNLVADKIIMGDYEVDLGVGLNIMPYAFISNGVSVGDGTLLNVRSSLHHDVQVGRFCDIAPGATLLGGVKVGDYTLISSNATVLPDVEIGDNCIIAAGAVVIDDVPDNTVVAGVPAKKIRDNPDFD